MRIGLVGCVKSKKAVSAPAQDLYISALFQGRRRYVERTCDNWFILSAKHGLVEHDTILDSYDVSLQSLSAAERRRWSGQVLDALIVRLGSVAGHTFEIHAEGLSQGLQLSFYASASGSQAQRPANPLPKREAGSDAPRGSIYTPLGDYLANLDADSVELSFAEIERVLSGPLPNSARRHRPWWGNERSGSHSHARAWLDAGWRVDTVDLSAGSVRYIR